jgi:cation-transporting P-type ATPase 13A2
MQNKGDQENPNIALAVRTGFSCEKGKMIKSIMFPTPERFNFYFEQNMYLVGTLSVAIIAVAAALYVFIENYEPFYIVIRYFAGITYAVPPELPVVMSMGLIFSLGKLRNKNIFCINPTKVRAAGRVSIMVFDKTGTLTESGLFVHCSKVYNGKKFLPKNKPGLPIIGNPRTWLEESTYKEKRVTNRVKFAEWKACCHSIALFKGEFIGDTLDVEMFKASQWVMKEENTKDRNGEEKIRYVYYPKLVSEKIERDGSDEGALKIKTDHTFDFSSELQRMSVIAHNTYDKRYVMYVKGSPEMIKKLSLKESIPDDYDLTYNKHAAKGRRIIALAYKFFPEFDPDTADKIRREEVEKDLVFLGFLIMINDLKKATVQAISDLKNGKLNLVLILKPYLTLF